MVRRWTSIGILLAVFLAANASRTSALSSNDCTSSSFPPEEDAKKAVENRGHDLQQRYVLSVFEAMEEAKNRCSSATGDGQWPKYEAIHKAIFLDGLQSETWMQEEQFGFNNARTLVNLLAAAPPRSASRTSGGGGDQAYCSASTSACPTGTAPGSQCTGQCTDCNIWFNDIFLDTLSQTAVESHKHIRASGLCLRNSNQTADCREMTVVQNQPIKKQRNIRLHDNQCSEPWLWQQPHAVFANKLHITVDRNVEVVPSVWQSGSKARYTSVDMPRLTRELISWSTAHALCLPNNETQWVHLLTIPLIANCSADLVSVGMCDDSDVSKIVMVGSSWAAVSLETYNIRQCGTSQGTKDVFAGSALCSNVHVPVAQGRNASNIPLQCENVLNRGFVADSYVCHCPRRTYFSADVALELGFNNSLPDGHSTRSYPGNFIASLVAQNGVITNVSNASCEECEPGCPVCQSSSSCLRPNDPRLRIPFLVFTGILMCLTVFVAIVLFRYRGSELLLSSVSFYLHFIMFSALLAYVEAVILFPRLDNTICTLQPWPRHLGFILIFGFLFAKVWRVQVLARMPPGSISPGHLDRTIISCIGVMTLLFLIYLAVWTSHSAPVVKIVEFDSKKDGYYAYEMCSVDAWRYSIHGGKIH